MHCGHLEGNEIIKPLLHSHTYLGNNIAHAKKVCLELKMYYGCSMNETLGLTPKMKKIYVLEKPGDKGWKEKRTSGNKKTYS